MTYSIRWSILIVAVGALALGCGGWQRPGGPQGQEGRLVLEQGEREQAIAASGGHAEFRCTREPADESVEDAEMIALTYDHPFGREDVEYIDIEVAWEADGSYQLTATGPPESEFRQTMRFDAGAQATYVDGDEAETPDYSETFTPAPTEPNGTVRPNRLFMAHLFPLTRPERANDYEFFASSIKAGLEPDAIGANAVPHPGLQSDIVAAPAVAMGQTGENFLGFSALDDGPMVLDHFLTQRPVNNEWLQFSGHFVESGHVFARTAEFRFSLDAEQWAHLWTTELKSIRLNE